MIGVWPFLDLIFQQSCNLQCVPGVTIKLYLHWSPGHNHCVLTHQPTDHLAVSGSSKFENQPPYLSCNGSRERAEQHRDPTQENGAQSSSNIQNFNNENVNNTRGASLDTHVKHLNRCRNESLPTGLCEPLLPKNAKIVPSRWTTTSLTSFNLLRQSPTETFTRSACRGRHFSRSGVLALDRGPTRHEGPTRQSDHRRNHPTPPVRLFNQLPRRPQAPLQPTPEYPIKRELLCVN